LHGASSSHGGTPDELDELASAEEEELDASAELDELDSSEEHDELDSAEADELDSSPDEEEDRSSAMGARSPSRLVVACSGVVAIRVVLFRLMFCLPVTRAHAGHAGAVRVCVSRHWTDFLLRGLGFLVCPHTYFWLPTAACRPSPLKSLSHASN
jgi:hypothetical protein